MAKVLEGQWVAYLIRSLVVNLGGAAGSSSMGSSSTGICWGLGFLGMAQFGWDGPTYTGWLVDQKAALGLRTIGQSWLLGAIWGIGECGDEVVVECI